MSNKKPYFIALYGCDDSTQFQTDLTDAEAEIIGRLGEYSRSESTYSCMPTLRIMPLDEADEYDKENLTIYPTHE